MPILRKANGFTLIEILVVVIIIATITGIALLSINLIGDDRELATERKRLATLIELAQDEAMMQGREFGLELMTSTYRFVEFDPFTTRWSEVVGDEMFRTRQMPQDVELELYVEDKRIVLENEPQSIEESDENEPSLTAKTYAPHIFLFSSGESTAFEIRLTRLLNEQQLALRGDVFGELELIDEQD